MKRYGEALKTAVNYMDVNDVNVEGGGGGGGECCKVSGNILYIATRTSMKIGKGTRARTRTFFKRLY